MAGTTKRKILNISLPPELYREMEKLAEEQAKAKGEFVREVIRQYVETDRRWKQIRKWGEESVKRLGIKDKSKVERIIEQYRKEQSYTNVYISAVLFGAKPEEIRRLARQGKTDSF